LCSMCKGIYKTLFTQVEVIANSVNDIVLSKCCVQGAMT
jgi:hypothetical protein